MSFFQNLCVDLNAVRMLVSFCRTKQFRTPPMLSDGCHPKEGKKMKGRKLEMTFKKILAACVAAAMCASLSVTSFATGENESTTEELTQEITTEAVTDEESTSEQPSTEESSSEEASEEVSSENETSGEENSTDEPASEESSSNEPSSEEESTEEPDKNDVISLLVKLLGQIKFDEVIDTLNDINEALGLPRVEHFTDIPAYADAIYEKLEAMGLGYADIINGLAASDLLDWLNDLLFGGSSKPTTTKAPSQSQDSSSDKDDVSIPDTGFAAGGAIAALATLSGSGALAFVLRKRNGEDE